MSDPLIVSKFHNETHDPNRQENKIYIEVLLVGFEILVSNLMLRCSLNFNPQSVIRYQQFALWVKMSIKVLKVYMRSITLVNVKSQLLQRHCAGEIPHRSGRQ